MAEVPDFLTSIGTNSVSFSTLRPFLDWGPVVRKDMYSKISSDPTNLYELYHV